MSFAEFMYKGFVGRYVESSGSATIGGYLLLIGSLVFIAVVAYFLGSCNFAIIFSKKLYGDDIRTHGSGNAGMTNMLRTYGKTSAVLTLGSDVLKAVVAVLIGRVLFGVVGAYLAGLACVIGHVFPVFYGFKGGKGVAVTAATIFMTNWRAGLILLVLFVALVAATRFISLGSVMSALVYPILLDRINDGRDPQLVMLFAIAMTVIVVVKHKDNISRLLAGKENKISFSSGKKKGTDDADDIKR